MNLAWLLHNLNALCIEWHFETADIELRRLAEAFGFLPPVQLPGIWLLARAEIAALEKLVCALPQS